MSDATLTEDERAELKRLELLHEGAIRAQRQWTMASHIHQVADRQLAGQEWSVLVTRLMNHGARIALQVALERNANAAELMRMLDELNHGSRYPVRSPEAMEEQEVAGE